jgi:opacity protein-like surface antigen
VQIEESTTHQKESSTMKKILLVLVAVALCAIPALAQDTPKAEFFAGYQYVRFSPNLTGNPSVSMNGGGGSILYNVSPMFGLKAEFTGVTVGDATIYNTAGTALLKRSFNMFTYMFGPQITFRKSPKVAPFAHLLFGGAYANTYANIAATGASGTTASLSGEGSKNAFAMAFGAGIDVNVHKNIAIRLGQVDYLMTRFSEREIIQGATLGSYIGGKEINNQSNFRYAAGIVFKFGSK